MHNVYYTYKNDEPLKGYIGMTSKTIESGYKGSGLYLIRAFKKYGKENFTRVNLGEFQDKEEAHYWEGFYINTYKTEVKYGGYNISPKGVLGISGCLSKESILKMKESLKGKHHSEETKSKMSKSQSKKRPWMNGRHLDDETKKKISQATKGKKCFHSEEHKRKISQSLKGRHLTEEHKNKLSEVWKLRNLN